MANHRISGYRNSRGGTFPICPYPANSLSDQDDRTSLIGNQTGNTRLSTEFALNYITNHRSDKDTMGCIKQHSWPRWVLPLLVLTGASVLLPRAGHAADIRFVVQPILDAEATRKAYQPLAEYIAQATGKSVELVTTFDYAEFWLRMKRGKEFNLILDASELIGKKIATIIPPAPGGLVMQKMFTHPSRQPYLVPAKSSEQALEMLVKGQVMAAMIPTPLAAQAMGQGKEIATVVTSPQTPHITLTAGPDIDAPTREKITKALLDAGKNPKGQEMLKKIGFPEGFETTTADIYRGYSDYLK